MSNDKIQFLHRYSGSITLAQKELARSFQRLAFGSPSNAERYKALGLDNKDFEPGSLYIDQALACDERSDLYLQLVINLQKD